MPAPWEQPHEKRKPRPSKDRIQHQGSLQGVKLGQDYALRAHRGGPLAHAPHWWADNNSGGKPPCIYRRGGVTDAAEKAKPGRWYRPGFAQSTWRLVAQIPYSFRTANAIAGAPFLPLALAGAGDGEALFRGGSE